MAQLARLSFFWMVHLIHLCALSLGLGTCSVMFPKPNRRSLEGKVGMVVRRGEAKLEGRK